MYLLANEIHIAFQQQLQKVNSNREQELEPEERDIILNGAMMKWIKDRARKAANSLRVGFEDDVTSYQDLEELKRTVDITLYEDDEEDAAMFAILPHDFLHYIKARTKVDYDCNGVSYTTSATTVKACVIPFPTDTVAIGSAQYGALKIDIDSATIFTLGTALGTIYNPASKYRIVKYALETVNGTGDYDLYWENYAGVYYKECFIVVENGSGNYITTNGQLSYTGGGSGIISRTLLTYNTIVHDFTSATWKPTELASTEHVYDMMEHYHYKKNRHNKPFVTIENGKLKVMFADNFIPEQVRLNYIKNPRLIDITLNQSCELSNVDEIVALAVQDAVAVLEDKRYAVLKNENKNFD